MDERGSGGSILQGIDDLPYVRWEDGVHILCGKLVIYGGGGGDGDGDGDDVVYSACDDDGGGLAHLSSYSHYGGSPMEQRRGQ